MNTGQVAGWTPSVQKKYVKQIPVVTGFIPIINLDIYAVHTVYKSALN
jgi:hypothetical protein